LTALYVREKTGKGQKIDVSLLHAVLHMYPQRLIHFPVRGTRLRPMGTQHPWNHPGRGYKTKDGTLNVMVQEEWRWPGFCKAIGLPELATDPRFVDTAHRAKNRKEMDVILEAHFPKKTNREWMDLLEAENQYCGEMNYLEEVLDHPQVVAEKMLIKMPYPNSPDTPGSKMENVRYVDVCARLSDTPGGVTTRAPIPGEHTGEILREFGFSDAEISDLKPVTTPAKT
jgi:crotonobetainyl-CoA:carnitine CoA-transferase CaiB-like acyl-CoA transferase